MFLGHNTRYYKLFCKQFERSHFIYVCFSAGCSIRPKTKHFQFWFENPENIFYTNCLHSKEGKSICQHMSRADFCLPSLIFQFWVLLNFSKSGPSAGRIIRKKFDFFFNVSKNIFLNCVSCSENITYT